MFLYAAEYESVDEAKADLEELKELHREHVVGTYDAAVLTKNEEGKVKIVDKTEKPTQVRRTMSETRIGRIEEETKNGKGRRIELSEKALDALRSHRQQQVEVTDSEYIFPSTTGTPTNSSNLMYRSFKPTLKRAGLP
jgi:integrase